MAAQKSNWGKELRMGGGATWGTSGRLSGGHHIKPEDFNRTGRRSDGLTKDDDPKQTGVRSNEEVRRTGKISDRQKILDYPKSTLGNSDEQIRPENVKPKTEIHMKLKDKVDASSEETVLSVELRSVAKKLDDQTIPDHQLPVPEDQKGVAEVNLQTVSNSDGEEEEKMIDHFPENNVATQCQEETNRKLSNDICNNGIASEPTTNAPVSSHKSLRI